MSDIIDLSQLPDPQVVEAVSYDATLAARKRKLIDLYPEEERKNMEHTLALESEPATKQLEENSYREVLLRQRVNDAALATMLAKAGGADLDQIGANYHTARKVVESDDNDNATAIESDSEYRYRIQLAFEALSVAGPREAYRYHALAADRDVLDAAVVSPQPAYVTVALLSRRDDGVPSAQVIVAVARALDDETVRPVADRVTVQAAEMVDYTIRAKIHTYPEPAVEAIMARAQANLDRYLDEPRRIGRAVARSALFARLHIEGVRRVELDSPAADIAISPLQCARCTARTIATAGIDA